METVYRLTGLDCPNCAAKIEAEVARLEAVQSATVNLIGQTLTVQAGEDVTAPIEAIVHSHEPEVTVTLVTADRAREHSHRRDPLWRLLVGAVVFGAGLAVRGLTNAPLPVVLTLLVAAYLILGGDVIAKAVRNLVKGRVFDENFLMSLSTVGAFVIGEYPEAVAVMLFYQIGEYFQDRAVDRSRRSITALMDIRPDHATVEREGAAVVVAAETVAVGDVLVIRPGERVPLDGVVLTGTSLLDTTALTGESVPRTVRAGDEVLSGSINGDGLLTVRVTRVFAESTASRIVDMVENAAARKAPTESFITTFARYYTPAVVILAALLAVIPPLAFHGAWADWIHRGFVFLVISCPCALVISIPLAFFGGIGAASRRGILVKGGNYLEALNAVSTVVFDKTGTLTKGTFRVTDVDAAAGVAPRQVLAWAALAESGSTHPIAASILAAYDGEVERETVSDCTELAGHGVRAVADGRRILVGNAALMELEQVAYPPCDRAGTKVYVAVDGVYVGRIRIADEIKGDGKSAVARLKELGVQKTVMLTGDDEPIARAVAEELGLDEHYARLLPDQKVQQLERLDRQKPKGSKLVFVGDGINDAPVLARADVGVAMGGLGSDAAIEAADVVLMTDEPSKLAEAIRVARATRRIVIQNIVLALSVKGLFLVLGLFGLAGMWEAVFSDVGVALLAVLNAMRVMKH